MNRCPSLLVAVGMLALCAAALLDARTTALAGTHVDSIFYNTCGSGFGVFSYGTNVGQVMTSKEGSYANNKVQDLLAAGIDPLAVMVEFGHRHGIEVFRSMRMNDGFRHAATRHDLVSTRRPTRFRRCGSTSGAARSG